MKIWKKLKNIFKRNKEEWITIKVEVKYEMFDTPNGKLRGFVKWYKNDELWFLKGLYDDGKTVELECMFHNPISSRGFISYFGENLGIDYG